MVSSLPIFILFSVIAHAAAQCGTSNHPNCANWQTNSAFCTNTAWPLTTRQAYCPTYCTNLGCSTTTTTTTTTDGNTNCAKWAANPTTPFCVNAMTAAQKTLFCAQTCAFEITPNADCALYTLTGTAFARGTPSNRTATPGTAVASGAVAGTTTLSRVFANTGCTVKLFTDAAPADTATGELETHVGTATTKFFAVTAANNGALSYTCPQASCVTTPITNCPLPMASLIGINSRVLNKGDPEPPLASGRARLYSNRFCPWAERALLYAAAKGIEVEVVNIDPLDKPEWYLSKHPQGKVPAFEKDGKVVIESAVIPEYLDAIYPSSAILPTDPYLRAKQRMLLEGASDIITNFYFLVLIYSGKIKGEEKDMKIKEAEDALDIAEKLHEADYFGGASPGYDWMLFPIISRVALFFSLLSLPTPFASSRWPRLSAWFAQMSTHPAVTAVVQSPETYRAFAKSYVAGKPDFDIGI